MEFEEWLAQHPEMLEQPQSPYLPTTQEIRSIV